jgi:hypothetical protein
MVTALDAAGVVNVTEPEIVRVVHRFVVSCAPRPFAVLLPD